MYKAHLGNRKEAQSEQKVTRMMKVPEAMSRRSRQYG